MDFFAQLHSKILKADDRSHGITDQERVDRCTALREDIVAKVAHEDTPIDEIHAILDVVSAHWRLDLNNTINRICGAACSNVSLDAATWISLVWRMGIFNDPDSDQALAQAFVHPLLPLFLETHSFLEEDQNILCGCLTTVYMVKCDTRWMETGFFSAVDAWRKNRPSCKGLGPKVGAAKRDKHTLVRNDTKIRSKLLTQMVALSGDSLVSKILGLVSFDDVVDRVHAQQQDAHAPEPSKLRRCHSVDQLRTLLQGT